MIELNNFLGYEGQIPGNSLHNKEFNLAYENVIQELYKLDDAYKSIPEKKVNGIFIL